jgi:heptosyltransferase I
VSARSHRFLIVRLGALGDVIHGIPVAAALRARFPEARIDWMVDPKYVELLGLVNAIDRKVAVDPRADRGTMIETIRELRRRRYTAAFDLQGLLKSAILARLAGARQTIGFAKAHLREPMARFFYTVTVDPPASGHVVQKNLALLSRIGIATERADFPLTVRRTPIAGLIASQFGDGFVVLNMGAAWPNKRWPIERFGAVAAGIREQLGLRSLVLWGPGEEPAAHAVAAASGGAAVVAPPTSIADMAAILAMSRLIVSGDTGPLHIAAAVGAPTVGLFGPTNPRRNGPIAARDISISRFDQCGCQYERRCKLVSRCIDTIAVDDVVEACRVRLHSPIGEHAVTDATDRADRA